MDVLFRAAQSELVNTDDERRVVTFVASDASRDSAGTVLNQKGWDLSRFNKNGIIGYQHKVYGGWDDTENPDNVIGKGNAYIEDDKLMVDIEFEPADINPLADKVYKKIKFGSLRGVSVGFLPLGEGKWGEGDERKGGLKATYYYAGQQLLEISVVNIPANPNALRRSFIAEQNRQELIELMQARKEENEAGNESIKEEGNVPEGESIQEDTTSVNKLQLQVEIARAALLNH